MKLSRGNRSREAARWLSRALAEQRRRVRRIGDAQDALAPRRDRWVAEFLERIQGRGFEVDGAERRRVRPDEVPARPKRRFRVLF